MVDEERLRRLLRAIEDDVAYLDEFAARDIGEFLEDEQAVRSIKYSFVTAIEGCAKVAHHISASEAWPVAETNGDAVRLLAARGVLSRELAGVIGAAVGFRNLLVHQYGDVDNRRALEHLAHLDDFRHFVDDVTRWAFRK